MSPDARISEVSSSQAGVFLRSQAIEAGFPERTIDQRVTRGIWAVVHSGVLRGATTPLTFFSAHMAAQLACHPRARISHRSSAYRGRRGLRRLETQVAMLPRGVENHDSVLETEFARLMQREGIGGFVHHLRVETEIGTLETDFAWPSACLIVETDGRVHDFPDQKDFDRRRDASCARAGWRVERFRWSDVTIRSSETAEKVRSALRVV